MFRAALPTFAALALALPTAAAGEPTAEARLVMDTTVAAVLAVLGEDALSADEKQAQIEGIALERFDFETMAKLVLKRDWRRLSEPQRAEFVPAFRTYLATSYGSRITRYNQEAIEMAGERVEPRGDVTVLTKIQGGEADGVQIDYRLRHRGGQWRIIDVVIEGISLVSNLRAQFSPVIVEFGPGELVERLKKKNAESAASTHVGAAADAAGETRPPAL